MDESSSSGRHVAQMSTFLLIVTVASYVPQYRRIRRREDATGISTWYLVFTTAAATEQLALLLVLSATKIPDDYDFSGAGTNGLSVQGCLDILQMGIVWLCSTGLFLMSIRYRGSTAMTKATAILVYIAWFSLSFGAFIFQIFWSGADADDPERQIQLTSAFLDWHLTVLNPCATASIVLSFFAQLHTTLWLRSRGSLSIESLAAQFVVFAALGSSWNKRLQPTDDASEDAHCRFITWYNTGGWAVMDSVLSSIVQGYLLFLAIFAMCMGPRRRDSSRRQRRKRKEKERKRKAKEKERARARRDKPDETTPLLPLWNKPPKKKEKRRFKSFLAKFKWRRKHKKAKRMSRWRRILRRARIIS